MAEPQKQIKISSGFPDLSLLFPPPPLGAHLYFENGDLYPFEGNAQHHSLVNAWWLAECSWLVYECSENIGGILAKQSAFLPGSFRWIESQGGRLEANTQLFVVEAEQFAVIAFRGTDFPPPSAMVRHPGKILDAIADIKTDVNCFPRSIDKGNPRFDCAVHPGVAQALQSVWEPLCAVLDQIQGKPLWITGHSLGGALATLLAFQIPDRVAGLYIFGSLLVGTKAFADAFSAKGLSTKTFFYVHGKDPAPNAFTLIRAGYQQVGELVQLESREGRGVVGEWLHKAASATTGFHPFDHAPVYYAYETWNSIY